MSYLASPRRAAKKYARAASRQKSFITVDLNDPPSVPPIWQTEGTSGVAEIPTVEIAASPIDVEAIEDDDVQLLSSSWAFSQVFLISPLRLIF